MLLDLTKLLNYDKLRVAFQLCYGKSSFLKGAFPVSVILLCLNRLLNIKGLDKKIIFVIII